MSHDPQSPTDAADHDPDDYYDDDEPVSCHICGGSGSVHELTLPARYATIAGYADCPVCDGTGEAQ